MSVIREKATEGGEGEHEAGKGGKTFYLVLLAITALVACTIVLFFINTPARRALVNLLPADVGNSTGTLRLQRERSHELMQDIMVAMPVDAFRSATYSASHGESLQTAIESFGTSHGLQLVYKAPPYTFTGSLNGNGNVASALVNLIGTKPLTVEKGAGRSIVIVPTTP